MRDIHNMSQTACTMMAEANTLEAARPVQIRTRAYLKEWDINQNTGRKEKDKSGEEDSGSIPEYGKPDDGTAECVRTYEEPA